MIRDGERTARRRIDPAEGAAARPEEPVLLRPHEPAHRHRADPRDGGHHPEKTGPRRRLPGGEGHREREEGEMGDDQRGLGDDDRGQAVLERDARARQEPRLDRLAAERRGGGRHVDGFPRQTDGDQEQQRGEPAGKREAPAGRVEDGDHRVGQEQDGQPPGEHAELRPERPGPDLPDQPPEDGDARRRRQRA